MPGASVVGPLVPRARWRALVSAPVSLVAVTTLIIAAPSAAAPSAAAPSAAAPSAAAPSAAAPAKGTPGGQSAPAAAEVSSSAFAQCQAPSGSDTPFFPIPFGNAPAAGAPAAEYNAPIVGMDAFPPGPGYWLVAVDGGVFSCTAPFFGSMGGQPLNAPVVGMAADPASGGYWLATSSGGVFSFTAPFYGSLGASDIANRCIPSEQ